MHIVYIYFPKGLRIVNVRARTHDRNLFVPFCRVYKTNRTRNKKIRRETRGEVSASSRILETGWSRAWQIGRAISSEDCWNNWAWCTYSRREVGDSRDECGRFRFYGHLGNSLTYSRDYAYEMNRLLFKRFRNFAVVQRATVFSLECIERIIYHRSKFCRTLRKQLLYNLPIKYTTKITFFLVKLFNDPSRPIVYYCVNLMSPERI